MQRPAPTSPRAFLSEDELFDNLVRSGFDFLSTAIDEFESSAKFSTVHFATAIELFLKAKLMREHWSLLLDKPDQADKAAFFRGDAKTASVEQTVTRLQRIASVNVPQQSRDVFDRIAKHRNKMVHFAHAGAAADASDSLQQIVEEQCAGWLAIRNLLDEWTEFSPYGAEMNEIGRKMERHREFLRQKFETLRAELDSFTASGGRVIDCPSCGFKAAKVEPSESSVAEAQCILCRYFKGSEITIECKNEDCRQTISFTSYDGPPNQCPHCRTVVTKSTVRDELDTEPAVTKDNYFDQLLINCPYCSGYHTVVRHHDQFVCIECFQVGDNYGVCEYCSEGQLDGVPEFSYASGCEFCDGAHAMNDD